MLKRALVLMGLFAMSAPALAEKAAPEPDEPLDLAADKPKLKLVTDGKNHYVAVVPFGDMDAPLLYSGDGGKNFYQQRVFGGGSSGDGKKPDDNFDKVYWDPRANAPYQASFGYREQKYEVLCQERKTRLEPVADADAAKLLGAAKFWKPRWKHQAYALARDNTGKYFFVDRAREPEGNKSFRLFAGNKGSLKQQKMTNVVSDSEGDIFATKTGSLRLILNKGESLWEASGKKQKLVLLAIEDNHVLIYTDLGVYTGLPLGTPCDDL
jgi:hypothetical protein